MTYSVHIRDVDGNALKGAVITFYNPDGTVHGSITSSTGNFVFDDQTQSDLFDDSIQFSVACDGYKTDTGWHMSDFDPTVNNRITLQKSHKDLLLVAGGAGAALLLAGVFSKKKKKVSGFFDNINPKVKIGMAIVAGVGVWYYLTKNDKGRNLPVDAKAELDQLAAQGIKPTFTPTQAEAYSNMLTQAFGGCGTDEDVVYQVFSLLKNKADLILLIYVYDVRSYQGCFEGMIWEESVTANLAQALSNELSSGEIDHVNSILAGNGIDFKF